MRHQYALQHLEKLGVAGMQGLRVALLNAEILQFLTARLVEALAHQMHDHGVDIELGMDHFQVRDPQILECVEQEFVGLVVS